MNGEREPSGIIPCYLNHDDFLDLVLISSREPAYLFLNDGKGKLDEIGEDSVLRKSFLREKNYLKLDLVMSKISVHRLF